MALIKKKTATKNNEAVLTNQIKTEIEDNAPNVSNFLFNPNEVLPPEQVVISIQGHKVGTLGNSVVITGKPKSRKSVTAHAILAAAISGNPILGIEANIPTGSDVVLIDTEQAKHDLQGSLNRMQSLAELSELPQQLKVYSFRPLDANGIKSGIMQILENSNTKLMIIDGGLDLINNMNDVPESKATIDFIKNILEKYDLCLVIIIHQSKSTNFTIGHFGSFMDRFSQSVIEVTKLENGSSEIKAQVMRSAENFKPYEFYFNHNINNYSINWVESFEVTAKNPNNISEHQHKDLLKGCFLNNELLSYTALLNVMIVKYKKSETWCKKCIKYLCEIELLEHTESGLKIKTNEIKF